MIQKNILFEESAVYEVLKELDKLVGYKQHTHRLINNGRYCIVYGNKEYGCPNIAILLKTEPFYSYGVIFNEQGQSGVGETININHLKEFIRHNVKFIYFKYRDGKLYVIHIEDFLRNSFERVTNNEGIKVRNISIKLLERVN